MLPWSRWSVLRLSPFIRYVYVEKKKSGMRENGVDEWWKRDKSLQHMEQQQADLLDVLLSTRLYWLEMGLTDRSKTSLWGSRTVSSRSNLTPKFELTKYTPMCVSAGVSDVLSFELMIRLSFLLVTSCCFAHHIFYLRVDGAAMNRHGNWSTSVRYVWLFQELNWTKVNHRGSYHSFRRSEEARCFDSVVRLSTW